MMLAVDTSFLTRTAGWSAVVAFVALIVAGITIALFFGGAGAFWGPVNDVATAVALGALMLPVLAVDRLAEPGAGIWLRIVTVAALAGLALAAIGQLLLVAGVIDLETSFVTGGVGIVPFFAWLVALAVLALGPSAGPAVSPTVGWLVLGVLALSIGTAVVSLVTSGPALWLVAIGLLVVLAAWLASLAGMLLARATAA